MAGRADLTGELLLRFEEVVVERMGLQFPPERRHDLARGIRTVMEKLQVRTPEAFLSRLFSASGTGEEVRHLAEHLTVCETYFFRDHQVFEILREHLIPCLLDTRPSEGPIRLWSAGCASGEEPFSLAMLLDSAFPHLGEGRVEILGTDINPHVLQRAGQGLFRGCSFRNPPAGIQERYFQPTPEGQWQIRGDLQKKVSFQLLNLADVKPLEGMPAPGSIDLVICRNVLMYFSPEVVERVVGRFLETLREGGWLIVSPFEVSSAVFRRFQGFKLHDTYLFRKSAGPVEVADPAAIWPNFPADMTSLPVLSSLRGGGGATSLPFPPSFRFDGGKQEAEGQAWTGDAIRPDPSWFTVETANPPVSPCPDRPMAQEIPGEGTDGVADGDGLASSPSGEPGRPAGPASLIKLHADLGDLEKAIECFHLATLTDRLNPGLYFLGAMVFQERGDLEAAREQLQRALYLDQDFVLAHVALGNLARKQGKAARAAKHFGNACLILRGLDPAAVIPESEGIPAGSFLAMLETMMSPEKEST